MNPRALFLLLISAPALAGVPDAVSQARQAGEDPAAFDGSAARPPLVVPEGSGRRAPPPATGEDASRRRGAQTAAVPKIGEDKEVEDPKKSKGPSDHAYNAMRGGVLGLLVGSFFFPWGLVLGPALGAAAFYGVSKWMNPD